MYTVAIYLEDLSVYCGYIFRGPWYILWPIYLEDLSVYCGYIFRGP